MTVQIVEVRCPHCGWSLAYLTEELFLFVCEKCKRIFYFDPTEDKEVGK